MAARRAASKGRSIPKVLFISLGALLVVVAAVAAVYTLNLARSFDQGRMVLEDSFPEESLRPEQPEEDSDEEKSQNILLLGSDARHEISDDIDQVTGARADAIMVLHIPAERDQVDVMSIMRDNWVLIEGHGYAKVNGALAYGGVPLMVSTIENFIGTRIDHVAVVDFEGFKGLTDALGGVPVNSEHAFSAQGQSFNVGPQLLDGEQALAFVRERKSFSDGDFQRARNQQAYLKGVINTLLSRDTLTSPSKISDTVNAISPFLTVDEGIDSSYVGSLGLEMRNIRGRDIRFFTSPTLGTGMEGSQSVVRPDWDRIEELQEHFKADTLEEFEP